MNKSTQAVLVLGLLWLAFSIGSKPNEAVKAPSEKATVAPKPSVDLSRTVFIEDGAIVCPIGLINAINQSTISVDEFFGIFTKIIGRDANAARYGCRTINYRREAKQPIPMTEPLDDFVRFDPGFDLNGSAWFASKGTLTN